MAEIKISAIVVCYNEERDIEKCLQSLRQVADELLVVDSFSTDRTVEICLEMGATVIKNKFEGYIEQKRFAASKASYPILLSLDADELLSDELIESVLEKKANWDADGYTMNRLTNYCGKWIRHSGWYPDKKLRLFDKRKGYWGGKNPHDRVMLNKGSRLRHLKGNILHYSYYTYEEHLNQVNRFSDIASKALYESGVRSNIAKIIYKPLARLLKTYIIKMGFLDGREGATIAKMTAYASYLKYTKLYRLQKEP